MNNIVLYLILDDKFPLVISGVSVAKINCLSGSHTLLINLYIHHTSNVVPSTV